ncbi:DNA polymerase III subunit beta [Paenibacillus sp. GYB003]|uniref:DNA polymerase III subunit beta n=1 Tax=Paenibacillus sp. GYB003 TaxID=2994392 RepID=UPI002F96B591
MATAASKKVIASTETVVIQDIRRLIDMMEVAAAAVDKSTIEILKGVLFEVEGSSLILTGSDSVTTVRVKDEGVITVLGEIKFVVPGKFFYDVIKKMPSGEIEIEINPNVSATLRVKIGKKQPVTMQVNLLAAEQYPDFDRKPLPFRFMVKPKQLASALRMTMYAALEKNEGHILSGIHFEGRDGELRLTATDRLRMAHMAIPLVESNEQFSNLVVSVNAVKAITKLLDDLEDDTVFEFSENEIQLVSEKLVYQTRLVNGKFPDCSKILNSQHSSVCIINRNELMAALERAKICATASDYKTIFIELKGDALYLKATSDGPKYDEEVQLEGGKGEVSLAADVFLLLDAIKSISTDQVRCKFHGQYSPVRFEPIVEDDTEQIALVTPVRMK